MGHPVGFFETQPSLSGQKGVWLWVTVRVSDCTLTNISIKLPNFYKEFLKYFVWDNIFLEFEIRSFTLSNRMLIQIFFHFFVSSQYLRIFKNYDSVPPIYFDICWFMSGSINFSGWGIICFPGWGGGVVFLIILQCELNQSNAEFIIFF